MHSAIRRLGVALAATVLAATGTMIAAQATVPAGNPASGVNTSVAVAKPSASAASAQRPRGSIIGRVVGDVDRTPIASVCVIVLDAASRDESSGQSGACTDSDGRYQALVAPGRYVVQFVDPKGRFAAEWNGNRTSIEKAPVIVVRRQSAAVVPAALAPGGRLSGRAVDAATGEPSVGACPTANLGRTSVYVPTVARCSTASGYWSIRGLPAGTFTVASSFPAPRR